VFDREAWAAAGGPDADLPAGSPLTPAEWNEVYRPLGRVVGSHLDAHAGGPFVIGLAGSVAVGKSTAAQALAALLSARPGSPAVEVVSTDGFLLPNSVLSARGLAMRKGFPESYDADLVARVFGELAAGREVAVPRYSHEVYDVAGEPQLLARPDAVIVEGVNALAPAFGCALGIYLDADAGDIRRWFVDRFASLVERGSGFYAQWAGLGADEVRSLAESVWDQVNLVNLEEHILATRWTADIVVRKGSDHSVSAVAVRSR
jgi:type I pantothenate kinase